MLYITSVERFAEARGLFIKKKKKKKKKNARGRTSIVLSLLAEVRGPLPQDDEDRACRSPAAPLEKLAKALLRFESLDDLDDWLDRHAASDV